MLGIIYILNTDDYEESLKSFIKNLKKDVKLLIINKLESDEIIEDIEKYSNKNIKIINGFDKSLKQCIEIGLKKIDSEYIYIASSYIVLKRNATSKILEVIKKEHSNIYYINDKKDKTERLYYALEENEKPNKHSEYIYLDKCVLANISIYSYVFNRNKLSCIKNITDLSNGETSVQILLNATNDEEKMYAIKTTTILNQTKLFLQHDYHLKDWYTKAIKDIYMKWAKKKDLTTFQKVLIYTSIYSKINGNRNGINHEVLFDEELDEFYNAISELFKFFDEDFFQNLNDLDNTVKHSYGYKYIMLCLKEKKKKYSIHMDDKGLYSLYNNYKTYFGCDYVNINAMNYEKNKLVIDASFDYIQLYDYKKDSIRAFVNDKEVPIKKTEIYSLTKHFAKPTSKKYTFQLTIDKIEKDYKIKFVLDLDGKEYLLPMKFVKPGARLSNIYPNSYWCYKGIIVKYKNNNLIVTNNSVLKHIKNELIYYMDLILYSKGLFKFKTIFLRTLYWILKPFFAHKRIWLYFDKLYKADDNGEFAIKYSCKLKDNIHHYYILNRDSYDFPRLKKDGIPLLKFNSLRHKLMTLYAENIVATHPDILRVCGYGKNMGEAFKNIYNANIICIAHGLTMQKNAEVQNRIYDNTMFYTTSSKYEVEHLLKPAYGYSKDQVALTGMARFDVMISDDKRRILITPTWRRSVSGTSNFNSPRGYNNDFKESAYYKIYNSLINDKKLIDCAKKTGYKIIFLLHPAMSAQIDDYDKNDYVEFLQATSDISYNDILSKASLMVTDYSGVQYDFAYMHKPIIYYHHKLLPPRFEQGALNYETMGFGEICTTHEQIISLLIKYMKNNCQIEEKYEKRINDFFAFNDHNNGKRIYEAILKFSNERR